MNEEEFLKNIIWTDGSKKDLTELQHIVFYNLGLTQNNYFKKNRREGISSVLCLKIIYMLLTEDNIRISVSSPNNCFQKLLKHFINNNIHLFEENFISSNSKYLKKNSFYYKNSEINFLINSSLKNYMNSFYCLTNKFNYSLLFVDEIKLEDIQELSFMDLLCLETVITDNDLVCHRFEKMMFQEIKRSNYQELISEKISSTFAFLH